MARLDKLLKTGSIASSLGVYLPAMVVQKGLGLLRVLLFTYLLTRSDYGLWGLAMMLFNLLALLLPLGSNEGLARYVSFYETRGQLRRFYRRVRWAVLALAGGLALVAAAASGILADFVFHTTDSAVTDRQEWLLCLAAVANALLLALYQNLLGFLVGMRLYRVISLIELLFGVLFTVLAASALAATPSAIALLVCHAGSLAAALLAGGTMLHLAVGRLARCPDAESGDTPLPDRRPGPIEAGAVEEAVFFETPSESDGMTNVMVLPGGELEPAPPARMVRRVLRFGAMSVMANLLWLLVGYISLYLTNRLRGHAEGGVYTAYAMLAQAFLALINAAWVVVFTHIARRWEDDQRQTALFVLEMAYKAVTLAAMSLGLVLYATAPLWVRLLGAEFRTGVDLLGGLMLFFLVQGNLGLMTILAKMHERPWYIALTAALAACVIFTLGTMWIPGHGAVGAALAAGLGMFATGGGMALLYFLWVRATFRLRTYLLLAGPLLFLTPVRWAWLPAAAWAGVVATAFFTPFWFGDRERSLLARAAGGVLRRVGLREAT